MLRLTLGRSDVAVLADGLPDEALRLRLAAIRHDSVGAPIELELEEHECEAMLQGVTDLFASSGLGEDDEPTALGYQLESIIDALLEARRGSPR